ncbi:DUF2321 domain-containing protein [candidate division TA06 bacterium]|uniref:DUF2321 domain-containing protein n=1 Tax=candidate division TA06 bacterium TaxID=2250710 RepID=A0A523USI9_UNCT6|nr:MAG: DUF2321 domain-containing protein [candidate division TA06 bacterium]
MQKFQFDVAQICENGHVVNGFTKTSPERSKDFCDKCGAAAITTCPLCGGEIRGGLITSYTTTRRAPAFCIYCGKPYPWTQARIEAAHQLAGELDGISDEEKEKLTKSIDEIVKDSPSTTVAVTRFKKIVSKAGKPVAEAFKEILVDVASDTAKKVLWPQ